MLRKHAGQDARATWWLATLYETGFADADGTVLVEAAPRNAVRLYRRGVELGDASSMVNLACLLSAGRGVGRNEREALRLEKRAAGLGHAAAAANAGQSYKVLGRHVLAYRWFLRARKMGFDTGLELAKAQLFGAGTTRNVASAIRHLRRVAKSPAVSSAEREEACLTLAFLQLDGWLVRRSYAEGVRWLDEAAKSGSEIARRRRDCLG